MMLDEWITTKEAGELLGTNDGDWPRKLARRGAIVAKKHGTTWLISKASVLAYAAGERQPGPKPDKRVAEPRADYNTSLSNEQAQHLINQYGSIDAGLRHLVESDMSKA